MKILRLFWVHLRIGIANEMQYRVNFFIQLLQSFIALSTGLIGLWLVFSHTTELGGWSRPELLAVMGVYTLVGGIIRSSIQPNMNRLLEEIQDGTLDFALTKPFDSQIMVSVREFRFWQLTDVLVGAGRGWCGSHPDAGTVEPVAGARFHPGADPGRDHDLLLLADPHLGRLLGYPHL